MENKSLQNKIEAILFYKSEPMSVKELSRLVEASELEVQEAVEVLSEALVSRGIQLVSNNNEYSLATSPEVSSLIEKVVKDEINRDLSSASLETLAIVAYKGPVSRKEIEYIRGVNSSFSLRNLLIRGLIEREASKLDERIFLYRPTTDLLLHLGVESMTQLPEWSSVHNELKKHIDSGSDTKVEIDIEE